MKDFLLTDQVGSLRVVADTSGAIVKRIDYDSFGNIIADSNPSFSVPFGFAGGLHDRDTGLVRFGARDYSPELGRFTAKDPIDFAGGDTNLYAYTMSDPINFIDPEGLHERPQFGWHLHMGGRRGNHARAVKYLGGVLFYPDYKKLHPYVQEAVDLHELFHLDNPGASEFDAYEQEVKFANDRLSTLCDSDPGKDALLDNKRRIIENMKRELRKTGKYTH